MLQTSAPPASLTGQAESLAAPRIELPVVVSSTGFTFPSIVSFPPFYTRQQHAQTWQRQSELWNQLVLSYCRFHRIFRIGLGGISLAAGAPQADLWGNERIHRKLDVAFQREILDSMASAGLAIYDPPLTKSAPSPTAAFVCWRRPEEWGQLIYDWITEHGLTNSIMTFYELSSGGEVESTTEWAEMPFPFLKLCLAPLVKSARAQVFSGSESGGDGVKFFSPST